MLVYANSFTLNPDGGPMAVIDQIATWVGKPRQYFIDQERLAIGIRELRFADGAILRSQATVDAEGRPIFPYHFCAQLSHGQLGVPGRRWVSEIGIRQEGDGGTLECSVLLKTDEISAKVTTPIQVTRPGIVQRLIECCNPVSGTPGLSIIRLTEENASAFAYEIEHENRHAPLILISCDSDGIYPVKPERMLSVAMGLAQVIEIPPGANTYEIQRILGRKYSAFGGAINVIFPIRKTDEGSYCKTILFRPDQIREIFDAGTAIESDILATITHQTNLPNSWRHISSEMVSQAILQARLRQALGTPSDSEEISAYEALLQDAADQLQQKDDAIGKLRLEIDDRDANLDQARAQIEGLRHALNGSQLKSDEEGDQISLAVEPLRDAVRSVLNGQASLEQALRLTAGLFPNRIVVLNTAFDSAKESDRGGFRYGNKAFELLMKLSEDYWTALAEGRGDQQAKNVFGQNSFASKESETLSSEGKRRRTFNYIGCDIVMEKHLKHGVKDSVAETLRIHFEWLAEEKKIVIGHCGKHLNF